MHSTGVDLSRSEVQKLIKKLSTRERINYRNITDKWVDSDGNLKYFSTQAQDSRSTFELINGIIFFLFFIYEKTFLFFLGHYLKETKNSEAALGTTPDVTDTGVVFYKGSILNIMQTMENHFIVEKERSSFILKNEELDLQLSNNLILIFK